MKVITVSHSYLEPENQKNMVVLSSLCSVRCVLPKRGQVLVFADCEFKESETTRGVFFSYPPLYLSRAQYLLCSLTLGFFRFRPDVINIEYNPWSLIFLQVLFCRRIFSPKSKIVCTIKKNTYRSGKSLSGKIKDVLARFTLRRVDYVIAASRMVFELYEGRFRIPTRKLSVCHHLGVDVELFSPLVRDVNLMTSAKRSLTVGYCGRYDEDKGVRDLIEAVRLLNKRMQKPILLRLMGRGAYSNHLDDYLLRESGNVDWLELCRPVPNAQVVDFLRALDIFVLPSRVLEDHQEHDGHVLLEAMATGVACVGTTSGIIPELLSNGVGVLVNPQSPLELSEALEFLAWNPRERATLAARGRRKALEEFGLDAIARQKYAIFEDVMNG